MGGRHSTSLTMFNFSESCELQFQQRALQQQQKERLLQQQQKQSLVVPSNATAGAELCKSNWYNFYPKKPVLNTLVCSTGISNYKSLLNNVPPNVSLQRSSNAVPDSQLSPGFTQSMIQLSPNQQRAQFSPQPNVAGMY